MRNQTGEVGKKRKMIKITNPKKNKTKQYWSDPKFRSLIELQEGILCFKKILGLSFVFFLIKQNYSKLTLDLDKICCLRRQVTPLVEKKK